MPLAWTTVLIHRHPNQRDRSPDARGASEQDDVTRRISRPAQAVGQAGPLHSAAQGPWPAASGPAHPTRVCIHCGCMEPFQDMTAECCREITGTACEFSEHIGVPVDTVATAETGATAGPGRHADPRGADPRIAAGPQAHASPTPRPPGSRPRGAEAITSCALCDAAPPSQDASTLAACEW